ncbi:MAG: type II toxin-antitoxin system RelE/ParE family toxin [Myxococcales bacterium]|nr:type II toxin-antitoxin system RelE/ParE family toxin [Myxococcales bacterium]
MSPPTRSGAPLSHCSNFWRTPKPTSKRGGAGSPPCSARTPPQDIREVFQRIRTVADTLESLPDRGRAVPELELFGLTSQREVLTSPDRIVYRSDQETVVVMAVFDGRRDRHDVLAERLLRAATGPA